MKLFKLMMKGTVNLHNDLVGTNIKYDHKTNTVINNGTITPANESLRQDLNDLAIKTFNELLKDGPSGCNNH